MAAGHAHEETRHGLIGTADLDLVEGGLVAVAAVGRALDAALLRVVPGSGSTEDVLALLALVLAAREDGLGDVVLKWACSALEAVRAAVGQRHCQDVGAVRADCAELVVSRVEIKVSQVEKRTEEHDCGVCGGRRLCWTS